MRILAAVFAGLIFGAGITVSGMGNPAKILNFFDIAGTWDPSLAFVMGGAIPVTFVGYRLVWGWSQPLFSSEFVLPRRTDIDYNLTIGSAVFGIGWGLAGFCPGGAVPALGFGFWEPAIFVASMLAGLSVTGMIRQGPSRPVRA